MLILQLVVLPESLNSLAEEIGSNVQIFQCNLNDPVAIDDLETASEKMGGIIF